jgi:ferritin
MIANQEIINAINDQIGNEFGAMLQYYTIGAQFAAEGLSDLSAHFYEQAEEEKKHALRIIQFVIDTGARVNILAVPVPRADRKRESPPKPMRSCPWRGPRISSMISRRRLSPIARLTISSSG